MYNSSQKMAYLTNKYRLTKFLATDEWKKNPDFVLGHSECIKLQM